MAKTGYLVIIYQDINPSSPTYNQTREERLQDETNCPYRGEANWIEDTKYCELTDNGMLTGYEITVYRDVEPLSSTYNQTREEKELNPTDCEADSSLPNWQNIGEPFCRQKIYLPGGLMDNDGYMVQEQQDMNEYSETAEKIREIETLDLENCPLPNTEPVWQIISESCHLVTFNGQLVYDGTKDVIRVNTNQYSPSWNNNVPETANIEDETNCPSGIEKQYRWVVVDGQTECVGYDKYSVEKKQQSTDGGQTWTDVEPLQTRNGSLIEANSADCGYVPPIVVYRWVTVDGQYECVGYDKYSVEKKQQSTDGGQTWTDVVPSETRNGSLIEANSADCGYVPPTPEEYAAMYLTTEHLTNGTVQIHRNLIYSEEDGDKYPLTDIQYSKNDGDWTSLSYDTNINVSVGDKIRWKSYANQNDGIYDITYTYNNNTRVMSIITGTSDFNVYGNVKSIIFGDDFKEVEEPITISHLFTGYANYGGKSCVVSAENLIMPTKLYYCRMMFDRQTKLTTAPSILPPTQLFKSSCYDNMFYGCTNLTTAPVLPATELTAYCYNAMFYNCSKLNYVKCLATGGLSEFYCTHEWLKNVSPTGTFVKAASMNDWTTGDDGIPTGWTVINQ